VIWHGWCIWRQQSLGDDDDHTAADADDDDDDDDGNADNTNPRQPIWNYSFRFL